jgi:hypothetical protein
MMLEVSILPTVDSDLDELAEKMRDIDVMECHQVLNLPVAKVLQLSRAVSYEILTGRVNGELVVIYGIAKLNILSSEASPWLLATPAIEKYGFAFARRNKEVIARWQKKYTVMRNHVHVDNKITIRWLRWLGFDIQDPVPYGYRGELFHPFELRR